MAVPRDSPIPFLPKRWQEKALGQCWQSSHACPPVPAMTQPWARPGCCHHPLFEIKPMQSPHQLRSSPHHRAYWGSCCGSEKATWELQYMASKAGPVLLVQGGLGAHLNPGPDLAVWLPWGHLFHAGCTGVKQAALRPAMCWGRLVCRQEPGLWGRTDGKAQSSAACFFHHAYPPHLHCSLLMPRK